MFMSARATTKGDARYCTPPCRERGKRRLKQFTGRLTDSSHRARARRYGTTYETVEATRVYERDGWHCQLCQGKVDPKLKAPHPSSASLDHCIPISLGGDHTYANTQLAHLRCNLVKGARGGGEQLALIG